MLPLSSWTKVLSFSMGCSRAVRRERFDIVHGHGNTTRQDLVTVHVCRAANQLARGLPLSRWDPHLWLERKQFEDPGLMRIITLSEMVKRDLHRHYLIPLDRMVTIFNGVDSERFHPDRRLRFREEMRKKHGIHEDEYVVLCVASGNFQNRGLPTVLAAMKTLVEPRLRLVVVGGDRSDRFRQMAASLGLAKRVLFVPFSNRIEEYYGMGDALVFPSYYDVFPSVPLEAMACGLPVIVSARAGTSEILVDGGNGYILKDPADYATLARLLVGLADPTARVRIGTAARATALGYSWDQVAERTLAEYEMILHNGKG
jgi:UDP-glucose:(heptosyl)LPS alpha-1,3-glucosyltransferase